jgi:glycerophosphoryl diester phosphodiesterase
MAAFQHAVEDWGVDMLEMDVRSSADGRVVVLHDATVDRTTDGSGAVSHLPWEALSDLDAGYRFQDLEGGSPFRGRGVRLPLFDEVLEAFPRTRLNVEIKEPGAARALVAAEHERCRRSVRDYPGPWGASAWLILRFWMVHDTPLSPLYTPRADVFQVPFAWQGRAVVTPRFLAEAHGRNIPVHVWTVDEEPLMRTLLEAGVDGLQTDRPDRLAAVLTELAGRPPAPALGGSRGAGLSRAG